jgi:phosphonate transport system substrate-binding protein
MMRTVLALFTTFALAASAFAQSAPDGSKAYPLRVLLISADGSIDSGAKADYQPVDDAVVRMTGLNFDIEVGRGATIPPKKRLWSSLLRSSQQARLRGNG